jgi:hypothetical protein
VPELVDGAHWSLVGARKCLALDCFDQRDSTRSGGAVSAELLPERSDERHQDEACANPDHKPRAEVAEQDPEPDSNKDPPRNAGPPYV